MRRSSAQRLYGGIAVFVMICMIILWWYFTRWHVLVLYLCAINVTTLLLYAWDKVIAGSKVTRVPEVVLHALGLFGGSPMAIVGQKVFRHKTRKASFQAWQYLVILVQVSLVIGYMYWL